MRLTKDQMLVFLDRYAWRDEQMLPPGMSLREYAQQALKDWDELRVVDDPCAVWNETNPHQMWERVARAISETTDEYVDFEALLSDFRFVPAGRILSGAGTDADVTFYNCYVVPIETKDRRLAREGSPYHQFPDKGCDSREAIMDTLAVMVDILSRGGGVGVNWSVLRPRDSYLASVNGRSSGPVTWMDTASHMVGGVEQGGSRRGAAMFMLEDWHPDILEFVAAKRDLTRITHANVSVAVSEAFMTAVKADADWDLVFPDTTLPEYDDQWTGDMAGWVKTHGNDSVKVHRTIKARDLWEAIAEAAWDNGEPGVVFLDRYNEMSTARSTERIISVNPCGEQGLGAYGVCNLGAMNLAGYVDDGEFVWEAFDRDVRLATRFLDRVIDKTPYFLKSNRQSQDLLRRIGLGVMGLADALAYLGIRYGSEGAVEFTRRVFRTMKQSALWESSEMARDYGAAEGWRVGMLNRPYFDGEEVDEELYERIRGHGLRNLFLLTQAPTGTTSLLAGVNSGIEPFFRLSYTRADALGERTVSVRPFEEWEANNEEGGIPPYFVTAEDVTVEEHIAMQAAVQRYVDSSVSKTINAPNSHTVEDVERAYMLAYDSGLKGLAYFRDGCGRTQVLKETKPVEVKAEKVEFNITYDRKEPEAYVRPAVLAGSTRRVETDAGTAFVTVNVDDDGRPREVFLNVGKAGSDITEMGEALGRLISVALQNGSHVADVAGQLTGIGGYSKFSKSLPAAVGDALSEYRFGRSEWGTPKVEVDMDGTLLDEVTYESESKPFTDTLTAVMDGTVWESPGGFTHRMTTSGTLCPVCGEFSVIRAEGCEKCVRCDWTRC